ncbi:Fe(3+) ABC transporter substrate-binding protein [Rhodobacteraceae bacterium NNCM2]|nr:Fe(3+) ABC transporter substrate-binding protein [Coraliihabitans acroporae]
MRRLSLATATLALAASSAMADVNIYSYRQPELIKPLTDAFTEQTGIATNVVFLNKGLLERLQAEGDRSPADLIFTVDISRLKGVVDGGVTQPVTSEVLEANVPATMRDPDGHWFGLTSRARIVYASKDRVAEGEVTTYEDLADPKWKGRICVRSGTNAYNLALISAMEAHHGREATKEWLEGLKANLARKPEGNDRSQVKAIWAGECDISIGNTYYMAAMLKDPEQKEWADSVRIVFPTFEPTGGTHMNISGVAMTKSAPNREEALKMMEFLASAEGQKIYAEINAEYPVLESVPASDLVESWGDFSRDTIPLIEIANGRPDAVKLVEEVKFDE